MNEPAKDLLGRAPSADEREVLDLYRRLLAMSRRQDLPPTVLMNVKQAMVLLWNVCNDLALVSEEPGCD
jgi:hypothetical protein